MTARVWLTWDAAFERTYGRRYRRGPGEEEFVEAEVAAVGADEILSLIHSDFEHERPAPERRLTLALAVRL